MVDETATPPLIRRRSGPRSVVSVHREWSGRALPACVRANLPGADLAAWVRTNQETLNTLAHAGGGVLFRGFAMADVGEFGAVMTALSADVLGYGERSSPRSEVISGVYTSTDYPSDQPIVLHNEQSYTLDWPLRIVFFCQTPPDEGGRTPIADSRQVLARLSSDTAQKFERLGVLYTRNYLPGISLPWQQAFQTDRREEVEAHCAQADIEFEWVGSEQLRTRQVRPAIRVHPLTGARTWFNHALFFHVTSLQTEVCQGLREALDERDLPYNTYYGNGQSIKDDILAELRACYAAETTAFDWRQGDVLVLENMLVAHGREPFRGQRRILVGMSDPVSAVGARR